MLDYWVRLYRQYQRPIEQVVIFLKETASDAAYTDQLLVGNTQHRYRVVRLWEQVAAQIDMIEEPDYQRNISACVEVLASLKFDKNFMRQFLREELMRESPIYQEIIQEGVQQGLRQGKQDTVMRQLTRRIGTLSPDLRFADSEPVHFATRCLE